MQISCPQCSTTYELDERVLPPGGAPVQCTRCSHVFNAEPPPQPDRSGTQIFGAPKFAADDEGAEQETIEEPPPPKERTQIYGGPGVGESAPQRSTQMFGAVKPPERVPTGTQAYGPTGSRSTQMFGAVKRPAETPPAATSSGGGTQIFGVPPDLRPPQVPSSTQIFGAPPPSEAPRQQVPSGTQIFGAPKEQLTRSTQIFGAPADEAPTQVPRSTQIFGSAQAPQRSTQLFGAIKPEPALDQEGVTPPMDNALPDFGPTVAPVGGRRVTGTSTPKVLDPFEPLDLAARAPVITDADEEKFEASLKKTQSRRVGLVGAIFVVVAIAVGGWFGYRWYSNRVPPTPPEAIAAHSKAITQLRRDDPASLQAATDALTAISQQYPAYAEGRASHLIGLLFQLDDVRLRLARFSEEGAELNRQVKKLEERKEPSDWRNRVNAIIDQLTELKKESDPLVERGTVLDAQVNEAFRALQRDLGNAKGDRELQLIRAQAVYFGVKGSDQAIVFAERYRAMGGTEGWGDLAYAEYALNTRVAPDTRRQAIEALEAMKTRDPSFIRLYVLIGRLALPDKKWDTAVTSFEGANTLNPEHQVARALAMHADKLRTLDAEPPTPPVSP